MWQASSIFLFVISLFGALAGHASTSTTMTTLAATSGSAPTVPVVRDTRPFHEVQNEVEELMTSGDRAEALGILARRLKDEKRESVRLEIRKLQDQISETFLTEKGLQAYELGRSLVFSDMSLAVSRFNEALLLEPENLAILSALARAHLHSGECAQTLTDTKRGLDLNENYRPLLFIKLQALVCLQKTKDAAAWSEQNAKDFAVSPSVILPLAQAQIAILEQSFPAAHVALEKAKSVDPKMPEVYYWQGQLADQEKKDATIFYRQYIEFCEQPNRDKRRQYDLEPRTCLEFKAVEHLLETRLER